MTIRKHVRRRSVEITVETDEVVLHRGRTGLAPLACPVCRRRPMVPPEQAARMIGASARAIYAWVEAGKVHFVEMPDGGLLVCSGSLPARVKAAGQAGS